MNPTKYIFDNLFKKEIAEGTKCWHEWSNDDPRDIFCFLCDQLYRTFEPERTHANPDYTTEKGFFELKAELESRVLWRKLMRWCDGEPYSLEEIIKTPLTFATIIKKFLKEENGLTSEV